MIAAAFAGACGFGNLECGFIGPHEQKTGRHGYFCVGATIPADED
jgi:hypothetical protein